MDIQFTFRFGEVFLWLLILCPNAASSGHIVGMANHYYSHQSTMRKLGKELTSRGHQYTQIIPHFLAAKFRDIDLKVINTSLTSKEIDDITTKTANAGDYTSFKGMYNILQLVAEGRKQATQLCQDLLADEAILSELKGNIDVILCDVTSSCCFILAEVFNATRVDVSSIGFCGSFLANYFGFPQAPVYLTQETVTDPADPFKFSFRRRLISFLHYVLTRQSFSGIISEDLWVKYGKPTSKYTNMIDAWKAHNLVLVGHDFALEYPRPMGPHVRVIGPILPDPPQRLPDDLHNFMNKNTNVVLVSFGTAVSDINSELYQVIADGLGKVSATVLWKLSGNTSLNVSQNIRIVSWIPQNDVLGHTSIRVFVTHCGVNSVLESAYHGKPMVAIPFLGDQHRQAYVVQEKGIGVTLDKNTMKADDLTQAIHEVLNNSSYHDNAKHISVMIRDRRRTPTKEGADWIEYALHHNGAKHLISEALDLSEYQLYCYDVVLFLLFILAAMIFMFVKVCSYVCRRKPIANPDKIKTT